MVCYRRIRLLPAHHQSWSITPLCKISALPAAEISTKNKEQRTENPCVLLKLRHSIGACLAFLKAEDLHLPAFPSSLSPAIHNSPPAVLMVVNQDRLFVTTMILTEMDMETQTFGGMAAALRIDMSQIIEIAMTVIPPLQLQKCGTRTMMEMVWDRQLVDY